MKILSKFNHIGKDTDMTCKITIMTGGCRGRGANTAPKLAARGTDIFAAGSMHNTLKRPAAFLSKR